jgi:hypothetical protein
MDHAIDSALVLALWNQGQSLGQIRAAVAPTASKMSVSRALRRAVKAGGTARPARPAKSFAARQRARIPERIARLKAQIAELERQYEPQPSS